MSPDFVRKVDNLLRETPDKKQVFQVDDKDIYTIGKFEADFFLKNYHNAVQKAIQLFKENDLAFYTLNFEYLVLSLFRESLGFEFINSFR